MSDRSPVLLRRSSLVGTKIYVTVTTLVKLPQCVDRDTLCAHSCSEAAPCRGGCAVRTGRAMLSRQASPVTPFAMSTLTYSGMPPRPPSPAPFPRHHHDRRRRPCRHRRRYLRHHHQSSPLSSPPAQLTSSVHTQRGWAHAHMHACTLAMTTLPLPLPLKQEACPEPRSPYMF